MQNETNDRLTAIEMKLAYMEDFVNQIQNVAVKQTKTIDKLQKEIKLMADKMREMSDTMEGDIPNRRPPHY
jgi:SlyX protein